MSTGGGPATCVCSSRHMCLPRLLQWVEGTAPLFEIYTSWRNHHTQRTRALAAAAAAQQQQQQERQQQRSVAPLVVPRAAIASKPGSKIISRAAGGGRVLAVPKHRAPLQKQAQPAQQEQLRPAELFYAKLRVRASPPPVLC